MNEDGRTYPEPDLSLVGAEHVARYEATGGQVGHDWNNTQCLILHVVGRRTGRVIKRALIYGPYGDAFVVVASKGGAPTHPEWYRNLVARPNVVAQVWDELIPVRARTTSGSERVTLWQWMITEFPNYDEYHRRTEREIPVVVLERR
jgi:deazaflavin-dependent oxidoreductase (nitroreductase family)